MFFLLKLFTHKQLVFCEFFGLAEGNFGSSSSCQPSIFGDPDKNGI